MTQWRARWWTVIATLTSACTGIEDPWSVSPPSSTGAPMEASEATSGTEGAQSTTGAGSADLDPATTTGSAVDSSTGLADSDPGPVFDVGHDGEPLGCDPNLPETTSFTFAKTIEIGVGTLQAGYYDGRRDEITVLSYFGEGRVLDTEGNILREVAAPLEALPALDGAAYDAARDLALLIRQACVLVEVDPETMMALSTRSLGGDHGISICAGLAIGPHGNLYIASYGTNELVVLSPGDYTEVLRRDMATEGFHGMDGIAEIAGSESFLVNSTTSDRAMIIDLAGNEVVPPAAFGQAPLVGGGPYGSLDSMLTICHNGHTWLCDEYGTTCSDFAPSDGDKEACACLVAG